MTTPTDLTALAEQWRVAMYPHVDALTFATLLADPTASGWDEVRNEIAALVKITQAALPREAPRPEVLVPSADYKSPMQRHYETPEFQAALQHEPREAPPALVAQWQPITTAPKMRKVITHYLNALGKHRVVMACYYLANSLEMDDDYAEVGTYDEATGNSYAPEGWYEEHDSEDPIMRLQGEPTHWMPLPPAPDAAPAPEGEQTGWLIERPHRPGSAACTYWSGFSVGSWTRKADLAVRFARREDAERVQSHLLAEHPSARAAESLAEGHRESSARRAAFWATVEAQRAADAVVRRAGAKV